MHPRIILIPLLAVSLTTGCSFFAHQSPSRVIADFGKSKNNLVRHQYFDPAAAENPSTEPPTGLDGIKAEAILEAYREDNSDRDFSGEESPIQLLLQGAQ